MPSIGAGSTGTLRSLSDRMLIGVLQQGSADAFEVIYDRHSSAAYGLARRILGSASTAEEVVQEAFLALWRGRDRYDPARGEVRGWLLGIVHNAAIDRLRRGGTHDNRRVSADGIEESLEAPERTHAEVERREQADEVRAALERLPTDQREVVELAYFSGLSHTQIASRLELPVGTIKGRMRLGLSKLRDQLTRETAVTTDLTR